VKTHIINLESFDSLASAKDKMEWGHSGRILLIWPLSGNILSSKLDLLRLKRHSDKLGAELALVVRLAEARDNAAQLGIPVFRSMRQARSTPWENKPYPAALVDAHPNRKRVEDLQKFITGRKAIRQPATGAGRLLFFSLGAFSLLSVAAILLPRAEIRLSPMAQDQEISLLVSADPEVSNYNLSGILPARTIPIIVEGRASTAVTGSFQIPENPAVGEVVFTNLTSEATVIPEGTIVLSTDNQGVSFATTLSGELLAEAGATITLPVRAQNPGSSGNVASGGLNLVEGPLSLNVAVTNPQATRGGSDRSGAAPSKNDYENLRTSLIASLQQSALEEIRSQAHPNDFILTQDPNISEILQEEYDPQEPAPSSDLSLILRIEFEIGVVEWRAIEAMSTAILDTLIPPGFEPLAQSLVVTHLSSPSFNDAGLASWQLLAKRSILAEYSKAKVLNLAVGQKPDLAEQRINQELHLAAIPDIHLFPSWWPRMPALPFRISVEKID